MSDSDATGLGSLTEKAASSDTAPAQSETAATTVATTGTKVAAASTGSDAGARKGQAASASPPAASSSASSQARSAGARPAGAAAPDNDGIYRIGSPDVLDIIVFKAPDLNKTVQVAANGTVNLPLVGDITVAGRTAQEVERDLQKKLGDKYLRDPQVTVNVKEFNSQRVTIEGAVKKPGVYPIQGQSTMLRVLAMAQGVDQTSDSTAVVFRNTANGKRSAARFDITAIRSGSEPDPQLQPGDTVVVGTSAIKEVIQNLVQVLPIARVFTVF